MKRHHLLFLFAAFIAITSSAQKLDNLVELKQKSENPLFHYLRNSYFRSKTCLFFQRERKNIYY